MLQARRLFPDLVKNFPSVQDFVRKRITQAVHPYRFWSFWLYKLFLFEAFELCHNRMQAFIHLTFMSNQMDSVETDLFDGVNAKSLISWSGFSSLVWSVNQEKSRLSLTLRDCKSRIDYFISLFSLVTLSSLAGCHLELLHRWSLVWSRDPHWQHF